MPRLLEACTLWGAAGQEAGGGTVVCKNRDWKPDHRQILKMHRDGRNYAYFGLYAVGNDAEGLKEGVNEKGLVVLTATASSIPKAKRLAQPGKAGLMNTLLAHYASCDAVLKKQKELFSNRKPAFLMISDRKKILVLEIGLQGRYVIKEVGKGTVGHANHFQEQALFDCNQKIGESSATRLRRIEELLGTGPKPFQIETFAAMSRDQHDGPSNSLWRTGAGSRTLSSWIVAAPAEGAPRLRVLIADPAQPEKTEEFVLDEKFWKANEKPDKSLSAQDAE